MASETLSAILLRRVEFGDADLILTLFSLEKGKISAIAKSAKKSAKRFSGVLELFTLLQVVCSQTRRSRMAVLQEAVIKRPFAGIRADFRKTAYASYWSELVHRWVEDASRQDVLYHLLEHVLGALDQEQAPAAVLSILFQMRFLNQVGLGPNLSRCSVCRRSVDALPVQQIGFDLRRGGLLCPDCCGGALCRHRLAKSTIKQMLWISSGDLDKAQRIRLSARAVCEAQELLESFVPFHLGSEMRSLKFLRQIRSEEAFGSLCQ